MSIDPHKWLGRITEPYVMFPAFALLLLAVLWGSTLNLIGNELAAARRAAAVSTQELGDTYEAQMIRALREIDLALKAVKLAYESQPGDDVLDRVRARELLPSELLFVVSISDADGHIVASSHPTTAGGVADRDVFLAQRSADTGLFVGRPTRNASNGDWQLQFSRRLQTAQGAFAGVLIVSVDAAYFVSGYEASKLGAHGVLGMLDEQGRFYVRRTGATVSSGDEANVASSPAVLPGDPAGTVVATSPWDQQRRYTSTRELYEFPLGILVGLSVDEQLAPSLQRRRTHLIWSSIGSLLLVALVGVLGRTSWQLAQARKRGAAEQQAHVERIEYLAYHDGLTDLPNRSLFSRLLKQGISGARRYNRQLAVLFLDLDRFKFINDSLGHEAGDELLKSVANRLRACLREHDCVARLGGDEFVVLLPELENQQHVGKVAQKILAAAATPFTLRGEQFTVTVSIGIAIYPRDGLDEATLTQHADRAMYQAKAAGKNLYRFHSEPTDPAPL